MNDEFYIGWQEKAPAKTSRTMWLTVSTLLVLTLAASVAVAVSQRTIGRAVFEWGQVKEFSGVLKAEPVPHLLVAGTGTNSVSAHYLVNPWKFGFDSKLAKQFDGQPVTLRGTRIYRDDQIMIEVERGSVTPEGRTAQVPDQIGTREVRPSNAMVSLGHQTFIGEIVDSKCFLGVMNPGQLKPHRACAVRCISGGVPPVLLLRQADGSAKYLLLVSHEGKPVNQDVLGLVAEPVRITGELVREGELLALRADPSTFQRVR
jgi:hypothetical protein